MHLEEGRQKQKEISQVFGNSFIRSSGIQPYDQELKRILKKLEDRVFCGTQKSYDIYKKFDLDKDGKFRYPKNLTKKTFL